MSTLKNYCFLGIVFYLLRFCEVALALQAQRSPLSNKFVGTSTSSNARGNGLLWPNLLTRPSWLRHQSIVSAPLMRNSFSQQMVPKVTRGKGHHFVSPSRAKSDDAKEGDFGRETHDANAGSSSASKANEDTSDKRNSQRPHGHTAHGHRLILTLASTAAHGECTYEDCKKSAEVSISEAAWLEGRHVDAVYYAPTHMALVRALQLIICLSENSQWPNESAAIDWSKTTALADLAPDRITINGANKMTWDDSHPASRPSFSNSSRNKASSWLPQPRKETLKPESTFAFVERIDRALAGIIGSQVLNSRTMKEPAKPGKGTHRESRGQKQPRDSTSHVIIIADQFVLQTVVRRLLSLGGWDFEKVRRALQNHLPSGEKVDDPFNSLMQFSIEGIDKLPLTHGSLSTHELQEQGKKLNIESWSWKFP